MGLLLNCLLYDTGPSNHPSTMKAFIFLCLVAAAMAEADPQYFYGGAHSYSPYTTYSAGLHYNSPYAYSGAHSYSPYTTYSAGHHYGGLYNGVYNTPYARPYAYGGYAGYGGYRRGYNG